MLLSDPALCSRLSREQTAAPRSPLRPASGRVPAAGVNTASGSDFSPDFTFFFCCEVVDEVDQTVKYLLIHSQDQP